MLFQRSIAPWWPLFRRKKKLFETVPLNIWANCRLTRKLQQWQLVEKVMVVYVALPSTNIFLVVKRCRDFFRLNLLNFFYIGELNCSSTLFLKSYENWATTKIPFTADQITKLPNYQKCVHTTTELYHCNFQVYSTNALYHWSLPLHYDAMEDKSPFHEKGNTLLGDSMSKVREKRSTSKSGFF